jgi:hypothetical protein
MLFRSFFSSSFFGVLFNVVWLLPLWVVFSKAFAFFLVDKPAGLRAGCFRFSHTMTHQ